MRIVEDSMQWETIVIGAGQAGLSAGYYLQNAGEDFLIIDGAARVGDCWRKRWDSLKLFTPHLFNNLPGWSFPVEGPARVSKDLMANYLEKYVQRFELPVRMGVSVTRLSKTATGYEISTSAGTFQCKRVIVATGTHQVPYTPGFARQLNEDIHQIHASQYRNPASLPPGDVLVIGSATSGIEIALEVSATRHTMIAGKPSFVLPRIFFSLGLKFYWWLISNVLTIKTPMGRKAKQGIVKGGAVTPFLVDALENSKVVRLPRVKGVLNGRPQLEDGKVLPVSTVIWCTGFRPDYSWIDFNVTDETGWPATERGVSIIAKGLYFVGVPFQFGLTSGLVGGVGRDADFVVKHMQHHFFSKNKPVAAQI